MGVRAVVCFEVEFGDIVGGGGSEAGRIEGGEVGVVLGCVFVLSLSHNGASVPVSCAAQWQWQWMWPAISSRKRQVQGVKFSIYIYVFGGREVDVGD